MAWPKSTTGVGPIFVTSEMDRTTRVRFALSIAIGIFGIFGASCKVRQSPLPEITSATEEGFHDLTFAIRRDEKQADGSRLLEARGLHHGREVGLLIVISPSWREARLGEFNFTSYKGIMSYRSVGTASDFLLQAIDELYGTALHPTAMRAETKFAAITLAGNPATLEKEPVKIKLFYESDDPERCAELFTNIDLRHGVLQINEKDEGYRKPVVQALTAQ